MQRILQMLETRGRPFKGVNIKNWQQNKQAPLKLSYELSYLSIHNHFEGGIFLETQLTLYFNKITSTRFQVRKCDSSAEIYISPVDHKRHRTVLENLNLAFLTTLKTFLNSIYLAKRDKTQFLLQ